MSTTLDDGLNEGPEQVPLNCAAADEQSKPGGSSEFTEQEADNREWEAQRKDEHPAPTALIVLRVDHKRQKPENNCEYNAKQAEPELHVE